jgi:hypothetical protein
MAVYGARTPGRLAVCGRPGEHAFWLDHVSQQEVAAVKSPRFTAVPKPMQATYETVVVLTDAFCHDHLTDEYRGLARAMIAALARRRPSPLVSGQPRT